MSKIKLTLRQKGGDGSGHFGHAGRPGKRGGSLPGAAGQWSHHGGERDPSKPHEEPKKKPKAEPKAEPKVDAEEEFKKKNKFMVKGTNNPHGTKVARYVELPVTKWGNGAIITPEGELIDITMEFGAGTNDHPGIFTMLEKPEMFGLDKSKAQAAIDFLDDEDAFMSYDDPFMEFMEYSWSAIAPTHTRVLYRGAGDKGNITIQTPSVSNRWLQHIQEWALDDKLPTDRDLTIYWESNSVDGWAQTTWDELLQASSIRDIKDRA